MVRLHEYLDASGRNEYRTWFDGLDVAAATKVTVALERLAGGNMSPISLSRRMDHGTHTRFPRYDP